MAAARRDTDMSEVVFEIVRPLLASSEDGDKMEVDGDQTREADKWYVSQQRARLYNG